MEGGYLLSRNFPWLGFFEHLPKFWSILNFGRAKFQRKMAELEEKVMEGLVKKLGLEKEEVEQAHTTFLDKHPEGQMTRFDMLQQAALFSNQLHMPI